MSNTYYVCLDVEAHEMNKRRILEVGMSMVDVVDREIETVHFIVEENSSYRNGRYVPDNRDDFSHGSSRVIAEDDLREFLQNQIDFSEGVVGHDVRADKKFLSYIGVNFHEDTLFHDTQTESKSVFGEQRKLSVVYEHYTGCSLSNAHNAGNDAHATAEIFMAQALDGGYNGNIKTSAY